ncbi:uncharacterized protein LOC142231073 [Haematobia irritans]|uniref:uncharacterized protein LOC142231073 n=1 Tax=Haematobia irritans TaxID=7368 RepID=UPI003F4F6CF9
MPEKNVVYTNGCQKFHHPLLHQEVVNAVDGEREQPTGNDRVLQCHQNYNTNQLFKILPVRLYGPNGFADVFALIDEGSSVSLIKYEVANSLGLRGRSSPITLQWYDNIRKTENSIKVSVEISSININDRKYMLQNVHTVEELSLPMQSFDILEYDYLRGLPIANYTNQKPSMLIGLEHSFLGVSKRHVEAGPNLPVASETRIGWVVYGPTLNSYNNVARVFHISYNSAMDEMRQMMENYFSIENFGVRASDIVLESDENRRAKEILQNSTKMLDGHYETGLLWKNDAVELPNSFEMANQRLCKIENRMFKDPAYASNYKREMNKYIEKGYAKLLEPSDLVDDCNKIWYLPHFGVTSPHKPDKLRIVFDAAAVVSNVSLNSVLLKGPESLQSILC